VAQEQDLLELLEVYRPNVTRLEKAVVGHSKVHLEGRKEICRAEECNLGNLVTDAFVFSRLMEDQGGDFWTDAAISLMQGGGNWDQVVLSVKKQKLFFSTGIRSSIEKRSDGSITDSDILSVLPWENDLFMVPMSGKSLRRALEHGAGLRGKDSDGGFLQVSGIHVVFNLKKPEGQRVVSVQVRCAACRVPTYSDLNDTAIYNVVVGEFLLDGGDGHVIRDSVHKPQRLKNNDKQAVSQYLKQQEYVYPEIEGRIIFTNSASVLMGSSAALLLISSILMKMIS